MYGETSDFWLQHQQRQYKYPIGAFNFAVNMPIQLSALPLLMLRLVTDWQSSVSPYIPYVYIPHAGEIEINSYGPNYIELWDFLVKPVF